MLFLGPFLVRLSVSVVSIEWNCILSLLLSLVASDHQVLSRRPKKVQIPKPSRK